LAGPSSASGQGYRSSKSQKKQHILAVAVHADIDNNYANIAGKYCICLLKKAKIRTR
jgi:hypothetical protein